MLEIDIRISGEISMQEIDIPGFGSVRPEHLVSDFTGTLSFDGTLLPGVKELLNRIARIVKVHVLTADTFGTARAALEEVDCRSDGRRRRCAEGMVREGPGGGSCHCHRQRKQRPPDAQDGTGRNRRHRRRGMRHSRPDERRHPRKQHQRRTRPSPQSEQTEGVPADLTSTIHRDWRNS